MPDRDRLEQMLDEGDQGAYEQELQRLREKRRPRTESKLARQREEMLESYLDSMDLD